MVPGAFNFRDVGTVDVESGRLAAGRVFRSDLLHREGADSAHRALERLGVTRVIDLRTPQERDSDGALEPAAGCEVVSVPVLAEVWSWDDEHGADDEWFLRDRTVDIFETRGARIVEVLELIATADGSVVFHCTAGKDRTGVVSAALLGLLGASRHVVVADYARSADAMEALARWFRAEQSITRPRTPQEQLLIDRAARPETMAGVIDHLEATHGGFAGWVRAHDGDAALLDSLRAALVTPE